MNKYKILYHRGCPDGWGSAFMLSEAIARLDEEITDADDVACIGVNYGDPMFDVGSDVAGEMFAQFEDAHLFIVDFCPPAEWLADRRLLDVRTVVLLDHHETAQESIIPELLANEESAINWAVFESVEQMSAHAAEYGDPAWQMVIDMDRSGIGLVAEWIFEQGLRPTDIFYWWPNVQDRDLWAFRYDDTKAVMAALATYPMTREGWRAAGLERELDRIGKPILEYTDELISSITAKPFHLLVKPGLFALCCTAPYKLGSDCAGQLAEISPDGLGAYVIVHGDHVQVGLRSRNGGPNCRELAELYGGGGHPGAAGYRLAHRDLDEYIVE